jgi:ribosomal protein S18 acetylase RimI-like enzyme
MFVKKEYRGNSLSKTVLQELELWGVESKFSYAVLETSIHFTAARKLYETSGIGSYQIIRHTQDCMNLFACAKI